MMMEKGLEKITTISTNMKEFFEIILLDSVKTKKTNGACLYASILLSITLRKFSDSSCVVCGGSPSENSGIVDKNGVLQGHYWVEGNTYSGIEFIADIAADQFGYSPVVVMLKKNGKSLYIPGDADLIREHVDGQLKKIEKLGTNPSFNRKN